MSLLSRTVEAGKARRALLEASKISGPAGAALQPQVVAKKHVPASSSRDVISDSSTGRQKVSHVIRLPVHTLQ